jgi:ketosteroid isomerase-like protein
MTEQQKDTLIQAVEAASSRWKAGFNSGNAAQCAAQYEADATMHARPFGTFVGTQQITAFWQQLIEGGYTDVDYLNPKIEVQDEQSAILSSGWKMNKAAGVITHELWVLQADGSAKLREDDFEALS